MWVCDAVCDEAGEREQRLTVELRDHRSSLHLALASLAEVKVKWSHAEARFTAQPVTQAQTELTLPSDEQGRKVAAEQRTEEPKRTGGGEKEGDGEVTAERPTEEMKSDQQGEREDGELLVPAANGAVLEV